MRTLLSFMPRRQAKAEAQDAGGYIIAIMAKTSSTRFLAVLFMAAGVYPSAPCILQAGAMPPKTSQPRKFTGPTPSNYKTALPQEKTYDYRITTSRSRRTPSGTWNLNKKVRAKAFELQDSDPQEKTSDSNYELLMNILW
ncbi:hypothetical protein Hypma_015730 [Hypsizygus marmoreus]|uniref:Uncharacterized protein n=1 Tax=Hypsizygus marmoreus TaxID=39966 RepID=A0A369K5H1_HYPMA|nr:hypothetical protein Hypma_015730 [Hypsizygus marmoreus]